MLCLFAIISGSSAAEQSVVAGISNNEFQGHLDAPDTDVITLAEGNYDGLSNLNITKGVTIKSSGQVNIRGGGATLLFNITSRDVQFINLNISGYGTVIRSDRGGLSITGCNMTTTNTTIRIESGTWYDHNHQLYGLPLAQQLTNISLINNILSSSLVADSALSEEYTAVVTIKLIQNSGTDVGSSIYIIGNTITATSEDSTTMTNGLSIWVHQDNPEPGVAEKQGRSRYSYGYNVSAIVTLVDNNITGIRRGAEIVTGGASQIIINITGNNFISALDFNPGRDTHYYESSALMVSVAFHQNINFHINITGIISNNNMTGTSSGMEFFIGHRPDVSYEQNFVISGNNFKANGNIPGLWKDVAVQVVVMDSFSAKGVYFYNNTLEGDYGFEFSLRPSLTFFENKFDTVNLTDCIIQGNTIIAREIAFGFSYEEIESFMANLNNDPNGELCWYNGTLFQSLVNITVNYNRIIAPIAVDPIFRNPATTLAVSVWVIEYSGFSGMSELIAEYGEKYLNKGYTVTNVASNFDFNWWGQNDISGMFDSFNAENRFTIPNNHYLLGILNTSNLDTVYLGDDVLFFYLVLSTNEANDMSKLPFLPMVGSFKYPVNSEDDFEIDYDSALGGFYQEFSTPYLGQYLLTAKLDYQQADASFIVKKEPTNLVVDPIRDKVGKNTTLSAKLTDSNNKPIADDNVDFYIDGVYVGSAVTDENGIAKIPNYIFTKSGNYNITAKYNGTRRYIESEGSNIADISKINTTIELEVDKDIVTATLKDDEGNILIGKEITLTDELGTVLGVGITNDKGQVQFTYSGNNINIRATFNGDDIYHGSEVVFRYGMGPTVNITRNDTTTNNTENPTVTTAATMKKTGIPLIAILLVLLSVLGICISRKQK